MCFLLIKFHFISVTNWQMFLLPILRNHFTLRKYLSLPQRAMSFKEEEEEDFLKFYLFNHKTTRVAGASQPRRKHTTDWRLTDERSAENAASSIRKHGTSHIFNSHKLRSLYTDGEFWVLLLTPKVNMNEYTVKLYISVQQSAPPTAMNESRGGSQTVLRW